MPIPNDLLPIIGTLRTLDPQRDSLDADGVKTQRRTRWQNFWGYVIYLFFCGTRARNPALDQATGKIMLCAEQFFNAAQQPEISNDDQQATLDAMTKLKTIVEINQGSDSKKIAQLLEKIQKIKPVLGLQSSPIPSAASLQLSPIVAAYRKLVSDPISWFKPSPEAKLKAQEIVSLLSTITEPPRFSGLTSKLEEEALLHAIIHTDSNAFKSIFPKIQPVVLTRIVDLCLCLSKESADFSAQALATIVDALDTLPRPHVLVETFINAFPSQKNLPSITHQQNFYDRKNAHRAYVNDHKNAGEITRAHHCFAFAKSSAFEKLLPILHEDLKTQFLQNLFGYSVFFLYDNMASPRETWEAELFACLDKVAPQYHRPILDSFKCNLDPKFLAHVCLHNAADKKLVDDILTLHPSNPHNDHFFDDFLPEITKSQSPALKTRLLEWLMDSVFNGADEDRKIDLIVYLTNSEIPFLAHHVQRVPASIATSICVGDHLKMADELTTNHRPDSSDNLKAIVHLMKHVSLSDLQDHEAGTLALFKTEEIDFQAKVLSAVFSNPFNCDDAKACSFLAKLKSASLEAWNRAGQEYKLFQDSKFLTVLREHIPPAAVIALLNGVVSAKNRSYEIVKIERIRILLSMLLEKSKSAETLIPFSSLSDDVLALIKPHPVILLDNTEDSFERNNWLWVHLLGVLTHPEKEDEKRLLVNLSRQFLSNVERCFVDEVKEFLIALTPEQMRQLPREIYPKPIQLVLALLTETLPKQSELVLGLAAGMYPKNGLYPLVMSDAINLYEYMGYPQIGPLLTMLNGAGSEALMEFSSWVMRTYSSSASADDLLALPRATLMNHCKNITKRTTQIALLSRLPDADARQALNTWWGNFTDGDDRKRIHEGFPFARMIAVVEDHSKLKKIAAIPLGFTYAVQFIPDRSQFTHVLRNVLDSFECAPWKLLAVLDTVDIGALSRWNGGDDDPDTKYPKCFEIIDWCYTYGIHKLQKLSNDLNTLVATKKWKEAFALVSKLDEHEKSYLLAAVRGPAPEELVTFANTFTDAQLFASLFDGQARKNLQKAILACQEPLEAFSKLVAMVNCLHNEKPLPPKAQQHVNVFDSVGGYLCPLQQEFNQQRFSDLTLQIGKKNYFVHKALLNLDSYFKPLLQGLGNTLVIPEAPQAQVTVAELRLKRLYGLFTLSEIMTAEIRDFLLKTQNEASSLAPLLNAQDADMTIKIGEERIKAHKFIIASAFEFFNSLFNTGMKETTQPEIELQDRHPEIVRSIVEMIYTGIEPELSNDNIEADPDKPAFSVAQLFQETLDFLNPPPDIKQ